MPDRLRTRSRGMLSNYPNGFANGISIRGVPIEVPNAGQVYWVNNSTVGVGNVGSNGADGTYQRPFSTIDYAIGRCVANRGDTIYVMPGHAETISAAGTITLDVAGVNIIGLGSGTLRPTLTYTATGSTVIISAANCAIFNMLFTAGVDACVSCIVVTAANATIDNCEFNESAADMVFIDTINCTSTTDNTADGLAVINCVATSIDDQVDSFIVTAADIDRLEVIGCNVQHIHANALALVEALTGKDLTNVTILDNFHATLDAAGYVMIVTDTTTANNGVVSGNTCMSRDTSGELIATAATNFSFSGNYSSSVADKSGYLLPAADAA